MINRDSHVHTNFSKDADKEATFLNYVERAKEIGITEIIFTDHHDIDPAHPLFEIPIDFEEYIKEFNRVKTISNFDMKLGVEVGYQKHTSKELNSFLRKYPFEYIVLSIHYIEKKDLYTQEFFKGKTEREAYTIYFKTCLEAIKNTKYFTAFGHLDYITRYSPFKEYEYKDYKGIIDKILIELINRDKYLEINTSGMKSDNRTYPKQEVIDRYIELGGRNLVYGSDAHNVSDLGSYFPEK